MTDADRRKLAAIRARKLPAGSDLTFLLGLIDELQREVGVQAANASVHRGFSDAFEQEQERLQARVAQLEQALRVAGVEVPPERELRRTPVS